MPTIAGALPNSTSVRIETKNGELPYSRLTSAEDAGYSVDATEGADMSRTITLPDSSTDDTAAFYRTAFWWMMGLGATAIIGTVGSALAFWITTSNALARLEVSFSTLRDEQTKISTFVDRATADRYTSTTAAADKLDYITRLSKLQDIVESEREEIIALKLWRAEMTGKTNGGKP